MAKNTFYVNCIIDYVDRRKNLANVIFLEAETFRLKSTKNFIPLCLYRFYISTIRDYTRKKIDKLDDSFVLEISKKIVNTCNYYDRVTLPYFTKAIFYEKTYYIGYHAIFTDRWELIGIYALKKKEVFENYSRFKSYPIFFIYKEEYEKDKLISAILRAIYSEYKNIELANWCRGVAIPTVSNEIKDFITTYSESKSLYDIYKNIKDVIRK